MAASEMKIMIFNITVVILQFFQFNFSLTLDVDIFLQI